MSSNLRNLTLASAKHLVAQGHITSAQHKRIVKKAGGKMPKPPEEPEPMFGQLNPSSPLGGGMLASLMPEIA